MSKEKKALDLGGYFRGEQGLIPDWKGKPTRSKKNLAKRAKKSEHKDKMKNDPFYAYEHKFGAENYRKKFDEYTGTTVRDETARLVSRRKINAPIVKEETPVKNRDIKRIVRGKEIPYGRKI